MPKLKLYYAPRTRSFTGLWLMEELGQPYELESFDLATERHRAPDYLALNAMGKVPMVVEERAEQDVPVSELGAMAIFLTDRYPDSRLGPAVDAADRPSFLRWCFFASAVMEPAMMEKAHGWDVRRAQAAWGGYELMLDVLSAGAEKASPWLLGANFSAADVLVGSNLRFGLMFGMIDVPAAHPIRTYAARLEERPAFRRAQEIEEREGARFPMKPRASES